MKSSKTKVTKVNRIDVGFRGASDSGRSSGIGEVPEGKFNAHGRRKYCRY